MTSDYLYNPEYRHVEPLSEDFEGIPYTPLQGHERSPLKQAENGLLFGIDRELMDMIGDASTFTWAQYREAKRRFYDKMAKNI